MSSRAITAQARAEITLQMRRGENAIVTLAVPIGVLVFFAKVDAVTTNFSDPVDFLVPGVLALSVMATAMVSLGIATGFERRYGVLKRLGSTPLSRGGLLMAKTTTVLALEVIQFVLVLAVGVALGWDLGAGVFPALGLLLLGTIAFAGIGMLMAGTLRAEANLAASNALFLVLLVPRRHGVPARQAARRDRGGRQAAAGRRALRDGARGADHAAIPDRRARRARRLGDRGTVARGPLLPLGRVSPVNANGRAVPAAARRAPAST